MVYESESVARAAVDCSVAHTIRKPPFHHVRDKSENENIRSVSCANWLLLSSLCINWCVLLNAAVTSLEALTSSSSCESFSCPRRRPFPPVVLPSWMPAKSSSRSLRLAFSALRFAWSWAFRNCVRALHTLVNNYYQDTVRKCNTVLGLLPIEQPVPPSL